MTDDQRRGAVVIDFFAKLFETTGLSRQSCWGDNVELIRLHNLSDTLIGLAYMAIPFALVYVARRRPDVPFQWLFWLFGAFIVCCGMTHFADVFVTYHPAYRLSGVIKFVTAVVSWVTLVAMLPVVPAALLLRSPSQLEQEVRRRTEELQATNAALQAEILERQRIETALKEADRRKNEFLATLAHELRNPLSPVRHAAHLLATPHLPSDKVERLHGMISRQVRHLARIVDDLLDVSRITHGKIELKREGLDLTALVRDIADDQRSTIEVAGRTLTVQVPAEPLWIEGDATRLAQVVTNLLSNAAKYTDPGGRIAVSLGYEPTTDMAMLAVEDTGIGMDAEILPFIFETFVQADRSLDRTRGGLGLGLALVRGLTALHGGSVSAESDGPGEGSRFVVRLPLTRIRAVVDVPAMLEAKLAELGPARVVVIEDHPDGAESLRMLLEQEGHEVRVAVTGLVGLALAREWRPDVIVCDLGLPGLDGFGVARALRSEFAASVFLIALSGYGREEDRERSREAGFDIHLAKPASLEALQSAIGLRGRG